MQHDDLIKYCFHYEILENLMTLTLMAKLASLGGVLRTFPPPIETTKCLLNKHWELADHFSTGAA
jgi:hypothetical protein